MKKPEAIKDERLNRWTAHAGQPLPSSFNKNFSLLLKSYIFLNYNNLWHEEVMMYEE